MTSKMSQKLAKNYMCSDCDYICSKKSDYTKHLLTRKHKILTNTYKTATKIATHVCECGKTYKHRQSLNNHKKKCNYKEITIDSEEKSEPTVEVLLKENLEIKKDNLEMKKMMIDLCQKLEPLSNTISNTVSNTHIHNGDINNNQIFNINVFLNEDCKDAMNMTEFIESIQLTIEDVEKIGTEGQTQALSNILTSRLNDMDLLKRPVHCSDPKKEIIYVKDENKWEKEPKDKPSLRKALDKITMESMYKIPDIVPNEETYAQILSEVMKEPREDKKILAAVSKKVSLK